MHKTWKLAHGRSLELGREAILMGILNVTPDSFSDGGNHNSLEAALAAVERMVTEGAKIIDIGGESTKPGVAPVSIEEEQNRLLPIIEAITQKYDTLISVDTYHADTARRSLFAGAHIINDVWGLQKEPDIAQCIAETGAGVVIMHSGREREKADDVILDQKLFLEKSLKIAKDAGIANEQIVLDPGFGFAKDVHDNTQLMCRAGELHDFGYPLLAGTSRKRFLGTLSGQDDPRQRDSATAATSVVLRMQGYDIFRVHNVVMNRDALKIADAVYQGKGR